MSIALLVPPPLEREIDALRAACGGSVGRVPAHLTLVPPVNVRDDRLMDVLDLLRSAAAGAAAITVGLGPPTTFLPDVPVLYLAVGGPGLAAVHALREAVFRPPVARPLTWPFVPHVTLAEEMAPARIHAAVAALAGYATEVTFDRVHLLQEQPGRRWEPVADAVLGPPAVVGRGGLPVEVTTGDRPDLEAAAFVAREWPLAYAADHGPESAAAAAAPFTLTARREGAVVGVAEGWTLGGVAVLDRLLVAAAHRGQGVGSRLLAAVESLAAARDCPRLAVQAAAGGGAEAFYRHRGWAEEARLEGWVFGRERVLLRRDLR